MPESQPALLTEDLFKEPGVTEAEIADLRAHLYSHGWQTRKQCVAALGWSERQVRSVAEAMGADIIRSQAGFRLTSQISRDNPKDLSRAMQAADAAASQARKMAGYAAALRRRLHALIG